MQLSASQRSDFRKYEDIMQWRNSNYWTVLVFFYMKTINFILHMFSECKFSVKVYIAIHIYP